MQESRGAFGSLPALCGPSRAGALYARCDERLPVNEQAALVPSLNSRTWAHLTCVARGWASDGEREDHRTPKQGRR